MRRITMSDDETSEMDEDERRSEEEQDDDPSLGGFIVSDDCEEEMEEEERHRHASEKMSVSQESMPAEDESMPQVDARGRVLNSKGEREKEKRIAKEPKRGAVKKQKPEEKKEKAEKSYTKFRQAGHKFFMTWTKLPRDYATLDQVLGFIQERTSAMGGPLVEYRIGIEEHDPEAEGFDPDRPIHFHAYFCTTKKFSYKDPRRFDLNFGETRFDSEHGEYYTVGGKNGNPKYKHLSPREQRQYVVDYCGKDGNCCIEKLNAAGAEATDKDVWEELRGATSVRDGMQMLVEKDPASAFKFGHNFKMNLEYYIKGAAAPPAFNLFDYNTLECLTPPLINLNDILPRRAVILHGIWEGGKTQWAKAHFKSPLFVRKLADFGAFKDGEHDGIVVDEANFRARTPEGAPNPMALAPEEVITLFDMEEMASVRTRSTQWGKPVNLGVGVPKILCTNVTGGDILPQPQNEKQQKGMERRCLKVEVHLPLYDGLPDSQLAENGQSLTVRTMMRGVMRDVKAKGASGELKLGQDLSPEAFTAAARALAECRKQRSEEAKLARLQLVDDMA